MTGISAFVSYRQEVSAALLQTVTLCPGFLTQALIYWTALLTQDDLRTKNVRYNFVTRLITCQNPKTAKINTS